MGGVWPIGFKPETSIWRPDSGIDTALKRLKRAPLGFGVEESEEIGIDVRKMSDLASRITVEPGKCGGKPCIRGMRIRVVDVLDLLANGLSHEAILEELPDLEEADIRAALHYARRRLDHTVIAV